MIGGMDGGTDLMDPVIAMLMLIMAAISAVPVALVVFRLKGEEGRGRLEHVYSGAVSRVRTLAGYTLIALLLAVVLQVLTALGMWGAAWYSMDEPISFGLMLGAALNYLPAVLSIAGLAAFLVGALPRATAFVWLLLVYTFFAVYLGSLIELPEWAVKLTPFNALARYPAEGFEPAPVVALCVATLALTTIALITYRRRDVG
jgi:ABC-2 type transport system permease protein